MVQSPNLSSPPCLNTLLRRSWHTVVYPEMLRKPLLTALIATVSPWKQLGSNSKEEVPESQSFENLPQPPRVRGERPPPHGSDDCHVASATPTKQGPQGHEAWLQSTPRPEFKVAGHKFSHQRI